MKTFDSFKWEQRAFSTRFSFEFFFFHFIFVVYFSMLFRISIRIVFTCDGKLYFIYFVSANPSMDLLKNSFCPLQTTKGIAHECNRIRCQLNRAQREFHCKKLMSIAFESFSLLLVYNVPRCMFLPSLPIHSNTYTPTCFPLRFAINISNKKK